MYTFRDSRVSSGVLFDSNFEIKSTKSQFRDNRTFFVLKSLGEDLFDVGTLILRVVRTDLMLAVFLHDKRISAVRLFGCHIN